MPLRVRGIRIAAPPPPPPAAAPVIPAAPPTSAILNIARIAQQQPNWCWAACCEMVFQHQSIFGISQCDMASWLFNANCCVNPSSAACNAPAWPDRVFNNWGVLFNFSASLMPFASLQHDINNNRPVESYYQWTGGGAHVVLVIGWYTNNEVQVNDPWYTYGRISYTDLVSAYGLGTWVSTYTF